jgi:hypothetical protein
VLEERGFDLKLVNAHHVKILPGRKIDVADAEWLAELLEHGLLRSSFVPPADIRQLRDLTCYRKRLVQEHTSECQRIQKSLEDAGTRLGSVASEVLGVPGCASLIRGLLSWDDCRRPAGRRVTFTDLTSHGTAELLFIALGIFLVFVPASEIGSFCPPQRSSRAGPQPCDDWSR